MYGVAAKIAQEILVLFQNDHFHAGAREQKAQHHSRWYAACRCRLDAQVSNTAFLNFSPSKLSHD